MAFSLKNLDRRRNGGTEMARPKRPASPKMHQDKQTATRHNLLLLYGIKWIKKRLSGLYSSVSYLWSFLMYQSYIVLRCWKFFLRSNDWKLLFSEVDLQLFVDFEKLFKIGWKKYIFHNSYGISLTKIFVQKGSSK